MNKKQSVALSSVFASVALTVLKLIVGLTTGIMGILSEGIDFGEYSGVNFLYASEVKCSCLCDFYI